MLKIFLNVTQLCYLCDENIIKVTFISASIPIKDDMSFIWIKRNEASKNGICMKFHKPWIESIFKTLSLL